jgi:hypothetical protein
MLPLCRSPCCARPAELIAAGGRSTGQVELGGLGHPYTHPHLRGLPERSTRIARRREGPGQELDSLEHPRAGIAARYGLPHIEHDRHRHGFFSGDRERRHRRAKREIGVGKDAVQSVVQHERWIGSDGRGPRARIVVRIPRARGGGD